MFHFFFDSLKENINTQQRSQENLSKDLDDYDREASDAPETATVSIADQEDHDENCALKSSVSRGPTQSNSSRSLHVFIIQTNSVQLADAYSTSSSHLQLTINNSQGLIAEQRQQDTIITLTDVLQLLFNEQTNRDNSTFTVFFSTENNTFYKHIVNSHDKVTVVAALWLSSESYFIIRASDRQLKLTDLSTVMEEAQSEQLETALLILWHGALELVTQLESTVELSDIVVIKSHTNEVTWVPATKHAYKIS